MTVKTELAKAAREVAALRERVADPEPFDAAGWHGLVARVNDHLKRGEADSALIAVEAWIASERRKLGLEVIA